NAGPAWMLSDFLKEDAIKVLDDYTIQFTLTQPYAPFLSFVPWWYVMNPKQVLTQEQSGDLGQKWLTDHEAGSGPFRIKRWEQGVLYAFDYEALLKIYNGNAVLQTSPFPNATRGHIGVPGFYRQDLARAKEFLAKSAYPQGGIELEYVYVQGLEEERKMGLVLIDNLA